MMLKQCAIIAMLLVSDCTWQPSSSHHYNVYVDPSFSTLQRNEILDEATAWTTAMGGFVTFEYTDVASSDDLIDVNAYTLTQLKQWGSDAIGYTAYTGSPSTNVYLPVVGMSNDDFKKIARHELGHAIGAEHIGSGNTMSPTVNSQSENITCEDVKDVCDAWGSTCLPSLMPACAQ